jgi:acyl-CoA thioester hydrolase
MTVHCFSAKVYLEDTDAQGIVYHANYLKYCERARTDLLGLLGFSLATMQAKGVYFVVFEMRLKFHRPASLHDDLEIRTQFVRGSDYRLTFKQDVYRVSEAKPLFVAESIVVTIDETRQLCPLPDGLDSVT